MRGRSRPGPSLLTPQRATPARLRANAIAAAAVALIAAAGCRSEESPRQIAAARPNGAVVIVVDTLRADHVGVYGATRDTTPALDRFAAQSVRFERAYSTAPWTVPSVASILTGLYPSGHGANAADHSLAPDIETLAEMFAAAGYATHGIISHHIISALRGFDQGFDLYDHKEAKLGDEYVSTAGVTKRAVEALESFAADKKPFFLFVHYFDPHYRYVDHADIDFADGREGRVTGSQPIWELRGMRPPLAAAEIEFLRALYDEEIRHTDAGIGELLAKLEALGLDDETVVVVTADHGEEFLERGWLGHTRTLYEELIRVPLLIRSPGTAAAVIAEPVSLVSISPTLLELFGIGAGRRFDGPSLAPRLRGLAATEPQPILTEVDYEENLNAAKKAFKKAVIDGHWKLIRDESSGVTELYDLDSDPSERTDLAARHPSEVGRLAAILDRHLTRANAAASDAPRQPLSAAELEQLRVLGYAEPGERDSR